MELRGPHDPGQAQPLPVARCVVERKVETGEFDYWDLATFLELSAIDGDQKAARESRGKTLAHVREIWEPETTVSNLALVREARTERGEDAAWVAQVGEALTRASSAKG